MTEEPDLDDNTSITPREEGKDNFSGGMYMSGNNLKQTTHPLNSVLKRISHYIDRITNKENEMTLAYFHHEMISVFQFLGIEVSDDENYVYKSEVIPNQIESLEAQNKELREWKRVAKEQFKIVLPVLKKLQIIHKDD